MRKCRFELKSFADPLRRGKHAPREEPKRSDSHAQGLAELQGVGNRALARLLATPSQGRMLQRWGPWGYFAPTRATPSAFTASCTIEGGQRFQEKKSFPIESFHWAVMQPRRARDAEAEQQQTSEFSVVKRVDEVSPSLFQAAALGDPIAKLEIVLAKGSSKAVYRFTNVFVTSIRPGGNSSGSAPLEEVSFSGIVESTSHSQ